jgi:FkbH-like protein
MLPDVLTIDSANTSQILGMPEFNPGIVTKESKSRRELYQADEKRKRAEQHFSTREEFLSSCKMELIVRELVHDDIPRVFELMTRTHQMNTTGQIFDRDKLIDLASNNRNEDIFVAELSDKFGWNGIIGTAVINRIDIHYRIVFFAMSCRILGRGIERAFLAALAQTALHEGYRQMEALFRSTGRNSMMRALYQMSGFTNENTFHDHTMLFKVNCEKIPDAPGWVEVI